MARFEARWARNEVEAYRQWERQKRAPTEEQKREIEARQAERKRVTLPKVRWLKAKDSV